MVRHTVEWLCRFFVVGMVASIATSQDFGRCQRHFDFDSAKDASVLTGNWVTLGSTRRVFSCNTFNGFPKERGGVRLEETWMVPGFVGLWKHEVTSEVTSGPSGLNVTLAGFDGLLMPGQLAIGEYGNDLLLVQCGRMLWFPTVSYTILTREMPTDPEARVKEIFQTFNVPSNIPSFFMVNHEGCDKVPTTEVETNGLSSRRSVEVGRGGRERTPRIPEWRILEARDRGLLG
ncbi:uncharacterized protein LOC135213974 [Macrobrachium nipponense]|uniref:uncharacterized protein LOC135213974 n=1 Tax=Macrobrachium nipponense TaxID=159736 RepID=UPI0030C8AD73